MSIKIPPISNPNRGKSNDRSNDGEPDLGSLTIKTNRKMNLKMNSSDYKFKLPSKESFLQRVKNFKEAKYYPD